MKKSQTPAKASGFQKNLFAFPIIGHYTDGVIKTRHEPSAEPRSM